MGAENRIDITPGIRQDDTRTGNATIAPGSMLVPSGDQWALAGAGTGSGPITVAGTAPERGKGINEAYAANETVRAFLPAMGDVIQAILAASQTVVRGDDLALAAGGEVTQSSTNARLQAEEDLTTGAGGTGLIKCTPKQS